MALIKIKKPEGNSKALIVGVGAILLITLTAGISYAATKKSATSNTSNSASMALSIENQGKICDTARSMSECRRLDCCQPLAVGGSEYVCIPHKKCFGSGKAGKIPDDDYYTSSKAGKSSGDDYYTSGKAGKIPDDDYYTSSKAGKSSGDDYYTSGKAGKIPDDDYYTSSKAGKSSGKAGKGTTPRPPSLPITGRPTSSPITHSPTKPGDTNAPTHKPTPSVCPTKSGSGPCRSAGCCWTSSTKCTTCPSPVTCSSIHGRDPCGDAGCCWSSSTKCRNC